jgi:broad specificity phosphatase PhoE
VNRRPRDRAAGVTSVLIVRHGETTWGVAGRYAGQVDVPLTDRGQRQSRQVARRLAPLTPDVVLTSPLDRCRSTADAIAASLSRRGPRCEVTVDERLTDQSLGEWTGRSESEIAGRWPADFRRWRHDVDAAPPAGESLADLRVRCVAATEQAVADHRGRSIVVVSHAAPIRALLTWALGTPVDVAYRLRVDNASVSGVLVDPQGSTTVWTINETGHLLG